MRIPFVEGAYAGRNPAIDTQALINYFVEGDPQDTRTRKYGVPTPGVTLVGNIANAVGRALHTYAGSIYAIVGNTVYQVTSFNPLTTTTIGTIATSTSHVDIIDNGENNGQQMLAVDTEGNGYVIFATGSQTITGATWTIDSGTTPFTITLAQTGLASPHNFEGLFTTSSATSIGTGTSFSVTGLSPAGFNKTWTVDSIIDSTDFYASFIKTSIGNSTGTGTGTIVSGTISFTMGTTPTFSPGANVVVSGCSPTTYNGTYTVATTSSSGFTATHIAPNPGTFVSGGTVSGATGVTQLTNGSNGWPVNGAGSVTWQDGYGIVSELDTGEIGWSALYDFTSWPALNFATAEAYPDNLVSAFSDGTKLFLQGATSLEVWYDAGLQNEAFVRIPAAVFTKGCVAAKSPGIIDNSIVWLGQSAYGEVQVYQIRGASVPTRISTPQIEWQIEQYSVISDAWSFTYQQNGHEFYVLTFPTQGATWVWDSYTQQWHQRSSSNGQWIPTAYTYLNGTHYVLDSAGNLYFIDPTNNTENGTAITRTIISPHFYGLNDYVMIGRAEVITNNASGAGPTTGSMTLSWSKDYGNTFTGSYSWNFTTSATQRFYRYRLGRARDWVFKLTTTSNPIIMDLLIDSANPEEEAKAAESKATS